MRQARQGVAANLKLAEDLRKQYKFKPADAALAQGVELARGGAPERLAEAEQARRDLAFVVKLDDIRFRKWTFIAKAGGKGDGDYNTKIAAPEYRQAFAEHGLDLTKLPPQEAVARIAGSGVKAEIVAAVDDWALYEPNEPLQMRLCEISRKADPGPWTDRLRNPVEWKDRDAVFRLAAKADPAHTSPAALSMLAEVMKRNRLDPSPLLTTARAAYPSEFDLAFALGQWHVKSKDGRQIGPYEAARALRPESKVVWNNLGAALDGTGDVAGAMAAFKRATELDPKFAMAHYNLGNALHANGDAAGAVAAYKRAIELDPNYPKAHNNLGGVYLGMKQYPEAIACARAAIKADPKYSYAHALLGLTLQRADDIPGARAALTEAVRLDKRWAFQLAMLPPIPVAPPPRAVTRP